MAKYPITHTCGHEIVHDLTGPERQRQYRISRLTDERCPTCEAATRAARHAEENLRATEAAAAQGWPVLEGTARQIAWATTLREQGIAAIAAEVRASAEQGTLAAHIVEPAIEIWTRALLRQTDAGWWIDRKDELSARGLRDARTEQDVADHLALRDLPPAVTEEDTATSDPQIDVLKRRQGIVAALENRGEAVRAFERARTAALEDIGALVREAVGPLREATTAAGWQPRTAHLSYDRMVELTGVTRATLNAYRDREHDDRIGAEYADMSNQALARLALEGRHDAVRNELASRYPDLAVNMAQQRALIKAASEEIGPVDPLGPLSPPDDHPVWWAVRQLRAAWDQRAGEIAGLGG